MRFIVLPDRLASVILIGGTVRIGVMPVTPVEIRERIATVHRALRIGDLSGFKAQMRQLAGILQWEEMLRGLPRGCSRLHILPDDSLYGCPFSALFPEDSPKHCLTIGFEIFRRRRRSRASSALVVAAPHGNHQFQNLPGATEEAALFVDWCRGRGLPIYSIDPDNPRRQEVLDQLQAARLAHVVCHGVFRADQPDESGLQLISSDGSTEKISLRDLSYANLSELEHLTLTSCWGADSFVLPGRFVISLPEICWRAGAHRVLASLWEVDDTVAIAFIRRFYKYLETTPADKALACTQRDCRLNKLEGNQLGDTSDPFLWAGFQLYGEA